MRTLSILSCWVAAAVIAAAALIPRAPLKEPSLASRTVGKRVVFPPTSAAGFSDPHDDPFYAAPSNIASYAKGTVVRQRATKSTFAVALGSQVAKSYQIGVASENTQKQAILAVATVIVPKDPKSETGILSFQNFEDATSFSCAPSWAYVANSGSPAQLAANFEAPIVVSWAINSGYYVVIPDHEGPSSSFIAGKTEGKIILDGIRGIIASEKLPAKSKVTLYGYSGGAHATVWGTEMHESYAPEINVVGAAHGGTPIDPEHLLTSLNGGAFAGFSTAGLIGIMSQHRDFHDFIDKYITDAGRTTLAKFTARNYCIQNVVADNAFLDFFSLINYKDPLHTDVVQKTLKHETLLQSKASYHISVPKFPRYIYHALVDQIVPFNDSQQYVKDQCARGADIAFATLPVAEHIAAEIEGIPIIIDFLDKAFTGTIPKVTCGRILPASMTSTQTLLGSKVASQLSKLTSNKAAAQAAAGLAHNNADNATGIVSSSSVASAQVSSLFNSILEL